MTQGIWVNYKRAKTKGEVKQAITNSPELVTLEATSFYGNEYDGPITDMPENNTIYVVGPDPYNLRNWYMSITRKGDKFVVR